VVFNKRSTYETLLQTIRARGLRAAIAQYKELKRNHYMDYGFSESELDEFGFALIRMDRLTDAIDMLALNAEMFPNSSDAYDSLADAYQQHGDVQLAVQNYRKALELNPRDTHAGQELEKLGASRH
jgi:Flp pilus assembly protein TadD